MTLLDHKIHVETKCVKRLVPCPIDGCGHTTIPFEDLKEHEEKEWRWHTEVLKKKIVRLSTPASMKSWIPSFSDPSAWYYFNEKKSQWMLETFPVVLSGWKSTVMLPNGIMVIAHSGGLVLLSADRRSNRSIMLPHREASYRMHHYNGAIYCLNEKEFFSIDKLDLDSTEAKVVKLHHHHRFVDNEFVPIDQPSVIIGSTIFVGSTALIIGYSIPTAIWTTYYTPTSYHLMVNHCLVAMGENQIGVFGDQDRPTDETPVLLVFNITTRSWRGIPKIPGGILLSNVMANYDEDSGALTLIHANRCVYQYRENLWFVLPSLPTDCDILFKLGC